MCEKLQQLKFQTELLLELVNDMQKNETETSLTNFNNEKALQWCKEHKCIIEYGIDYPHEKENEWVRVKVGLQFEVKRPTLIEAVLHCKFRYNICNNDYSKHFQYCDDLKPSVFNHVSEENNFVNDYKPNHQLKCSWLINGWFTTDKEERGTNICGVYLFKDDTITVRYFDDTEIVNDIKVAKVVDRVVNKVKEIYGLENAGTMIAFGRIQFEQ